MIWIAHNIEVPLEEEKWHQEQNIYITLFMPLIYQGKHLGSLGFASRTEKHFSEHDKTLAKAYAEQVAPNIEHTRLYQLLCEQEVIASYMANIGAHLKVVARAKPFSTQQLIMLGSAC